MAFSPKIAPLERFCLRLNSKPIKGEVASSLWLDGAQLGVIPAKAGTHVEAGADRELGPCFRRDDSRWVGWTAALPALHKKLHPHPKDQLAFIVSSIVCRPKAPTGAEILDVRIHR